jgi:hypothetical protein
MGVPAYMSNETGENRHTPEGWNNEGQLNHELSQFKMLCYVRVARGESLFLLKVDPGANCRSNACLPIWVEHHPSGTLRNQYIQHSHFSEIAPPLFPLAVATKLSAQVLLLDHDDGRLVLRIIGLENYTSCGRDHVKD